MVVPEVLVLDEYDEWQMYAQTGIGRYPVKDAFFDEHSGRLVVVLDYQELSILMHSRRINPRSSGGRYQNPDPGEP